jgi:hypothetical protein
MEFSNYKIFTNGKNEVIATSTYAGKTVRGIARLDPRDSFDLDKGVQLAIARCNAKVATKRSKRAIKEMQKAEKDLINAESKYANMQKYFSDSIAEESKAYKAIDEIIKNM